MQANVTAKLETEEWLSLHTGYCQRYHALISTDACSKTRQLSSRLRSVDHRCEGCGGMDHQPDPAARQQRIDLLLKEEAAAAKEVAGGNETLEDLAEVLMEDDEIEDELLSELFPELYESVEDGFSSPVDEEISEQGRGLNPRKVAVYTGRCQRCGGYMKHDIEGEGGSRDDEVYRCYNCGWRTSPGYDWNRSQLHFR